MTSIGRTCRAAASARVRARFYLFVKDAAGTGSPQSVHTFHHGRLYRRGRSTGAGL